MTTGEHSNAEGIAIIGMAGRFPGARNVGEFWQNLLAGKDCISRLSDAQLAASGYDPKQLRALPGYVAARGLVERPEWFDRAFFGIPPKEAEVMDPQHRVFLEVAWEALEDAGCDPSTDPRLIGVFAGMSNNTYYPYFVRQRRDLLESVGNVSAVIANEKDFLTTRLAYKLNLRGPALNIQTACSSSLVAVGVACQNLLGHECDVALAGGVSLTFPQERGYFYQEGSMTSPDGACRPFDERASGTVFSSGAGVVVLKRLSEALADGDQIYAVIKGHAVNNDGGTKVSFAAPSVTGHGEVIALAQAVADVSPETISYIEAHGTATALGDPIEIAGLSQVFRAATKAKQFCALGSVKGNIGHLDAASGVASLIKAALALRHGKLPASLNCEVINPALEIEESPFFINTTLREWPRAGAPRRAGVSSFGVGGTNAHVVLEEAPALAASNLGKPAQAFLLSAKTATVLEARAADLATHLERNPQQPLADIAFTLQTGRRVFAHRRVVVARSHSDATTALRSSSKLGRIEESLDTPVAFLFPGQGSQYGGMGSQLHASEPVFRDAVAECAEILRPILGLDLREMIFATGPEAEQRLRETRFTQPAIFTIDYALARLWISYGLRPVALLGHSVGEFAAATIANIFSLEDALTLVSKRAQLVHALPRGAMLAARLSAAEAREFLGDSVDLAAVNSPKLCVFSGPSETISQLAAKLDEQGVPARQLATSHAFHSAMVEPVVAPFAAAVRAIRLNAPTLPIMSCVTGQWLTDAQATDPDYWARHLRATVRFSDAVSVLLAEKNFAFIEAGPGQTLAQLSRQSSAKTARHEIAPSVVEGSDEDESIATALGRMWLAGARVDWLRVHADETRRRVSLPTYPFERQRYFADLPLGMAMPLTTAATDGEAPVEASAIRSSAPAPREETLIVDVVEAAPEDAMLQQLTAVLAEISGLDLTGVASSTTFLELGFDSLFLSQTALTLSRKFGVKITFRQLLRECGTLESLATHLTESAPKTTSHPVKRSGESAKNRESIGSDRDKQAVQAHGPFRPVQRDLATELSASQQHWLDDFIGRYNARTEKSKAHTQQNRAHFADPRAVSGFKQAWKEIVYPIVVDRSAGANLWDIDGNEWIDITLSFGAAMLGHRPEFLMEALTAQMKRGMEIGPTSPLAGEVAKLLCELTGMERATFCNTGSEAVTGAIRLARTVTGRARIVYFTESYHGISDEVLGRRIGDHAAPIAPGIPPEALANALILDYGDPRSLEIIEANADDIACVLVEPVQSRRPGFQPREFLHELRALTAKQGIALVFDEIITGFRCHPGGAQAHFGVQADLATFGKVMGGGLPIGAIAGSAQFMDALDGGAWNFGDDSFPEAAVTFFAGTFVRHPLALAAAHAVLSRFKNEGVALQQNLAERAEKMIAGINGALAGSPFSAQHFTSNWLIHTEPGFQHSALLFALLRHRGLHVWEGRPCFVSTAHSDAALERIVAAFAESVEELAAGGFISRRHPKRIAAPSKDDGVIEIPLTESQREVWLLCARSETANSACNETWTLELDGTLDEQALRTAIQTIVNRHDALRATFDRFGEVLRVAPSLTLEVPLVDLSQLPEAGRTARFSEMRANESARVFDLAHGPMLALKIVRLAPDRHALIFNAHHLACDGWSCDIYLHELATIYSARCAGRDEALPPAMQMREFQRWEQTSRATPEFSEDAAFWLEKYRAVPSPLELPGRHPRPAQSSYRGACEVMAFPDDFPQKLTRVGAQHGATLFTVLLTAYQTLLFQLTGQDDLVVGVASAGQNLVEGEHLIGHCVNMLPLRAKLHGGQSFSSSLKEAQTTVLEAFEHQRVTFGWLLQKLVLPRTPGRMPLISAVFNLDPPLSHLAFSGLKHRLEANPRSAFQFDLGINCDTANGFRIICNYNTDLFDAATIQRWLGDFRAILEAAIADSSQALEQLLPAPSRAHDQLVAQWNQTQRPFPADRGVHQIFEEQAARAGEAIAVIGDEETLTYGELNFRANQLACMLAEKGVVRGMCVGICLERSPEFIVGLLAILKAGAAYVPLDPSYPSERLALMIGITQTRVVLTHSKLSGLLADAGVELVFVDAAIGKTANIPNPVLPSSGDDLAYVMFTSGSTGQPKGVSILHRGISRLVINTDYVQLTPEDVVAQAANTAFDAATFEIWGALLNGARLVITPQETLLSAPALKAHCLEHGITTLFLTTALFNQLARVGGGVFTAIKQLLFGGEAADARVVKKVLGNGRPHRLIHVYGPTEVTTFATWHELTHIENESVPIGRPIANTTVYLLDASGTPVRIGERGEIFLGGPGLARGYHGVPDLTAQRFVQTPFGQLYRSGDLGRWQPDGTVEFLGRVDEQVKLRGFRIEPGEIEQTAKRHPAVKEAVVTIFGEGETRRLVAHAVAPGLARGELEQFLAEQLPPYLRPSSIVLLDEMPLNLNGKIDRAALRDPATRVAVPPRNELETKLVEIWEEALGRKSIGVQDDFFELGGHSLLAVRMFAKIEETLGKNLPLATLFTSPTVEQLAHEIQAGDSQVRWGSIVPIHPCGTRTPFFCIHGGDGGVLHYTELANALPADQPFYGLQAQGLNGQPIQHTSITSMVQFYIEEMRKVQPRGPYLIGGFSFGGVAAFEMAQQLQAQGEEVGLCALFDTINPARPGRRYTLPERIRMRREAMMPLPLRQQATYLFGRVAGKVLANLSKERERMRKLASRMRKGTDGNVRSEYRALHVREAHLKAFLEYQPHFFAGEITLFRAENPNDGYQWTDELGWEGLVEKMEIRHIPGEHQTIFQQPNVEVLARELDACLQTAARAVHHA